MKTPPYVGRQSTRNDPESRRLDDEAARAANWKRWGPYLAEREWGTVREDYSADGEAWRDFTHDQARSRTYRWGEDGLMGICDRQGRLCFAVALWNGNDPFLKERLFGLTGPEGNHGEDVKEAYFYLDSTPTHSYMRALYKYPQTRFPYERLVAENARRSREEREFELEDTGIFDEHRYFDVDVEYAKGAPEDILIAITVTNRGPEAAPCHVLPQLWFRNTWSWGRSGEEYPVRPLLSQHGSHRIIATHHTLGTYECIAADGPHASAPELLFTENETNLDRLYGVHNASPFTKDAFHRYVVDGARDAVNLTGRGTKSAFYYRCTLAPGESATFRLRLCSEGQQPSDALGADFTGVFTARRKEAEQFYEGHMAPGMPAAERNVVRQAYAGMFWSKQFYYYVVREWLQGDPASPPPPASRKLGRNYQWEHVHCRDIISMSDTWEYPWFAAWDVAFHTVAFGSVDNRFAREQLLLFLREWYMDSSGQLPAYEWAFDDVNPPVHAWACWRVYKMSGPRGQRDRVFLERAFHKLLINFTWWVNRKDLDGKHIFGGGFLGLDNIGVFDRSKPWPTGGRLEQADGTAWMAFYCLTMLSISLELASVDQSYEDVASKFFEHFVAICDAMNALGDGGLWNDEDGFYYDQLHVDGQQVPMRIRSMVGLVPLFAVDILEQSVVDGLPGFKRRLEWFVRNRPDLNTHIALVDAHEGNGDEHRLLAVPSRERLRRALRYVCDENEFLSPYGIRSLSRVHAERPFVLRVDGVEHRVEYVPGESNSGLFGGNSNWRGPVWIPLNYLLIEALERYHHFYGDEFTVEYPTGSGNQATLAEIARDISRRIASLFLPSDDAFTGRPSHGGSERFAVDGHWKDLVLFHEYFDGDTGRGLGASHQTGWTALVARLLNDLTA